MARNALSPNYQDHLVPRATRVLIAEDDADMREMIALTLSDSGFEVCLAEDGAAALRMVHQRSSQEPFDAIVVDMWMPHMTGLEVLEELRSQHCQTPVIFVSGFVTGDVFQEAERLGATHILPKPFSLEQLIEAVREVGQLSDD